MKHLAVILSNSNLFREQILPKVKNLIENDYHTIICDDCTDAISYLSVKTDTVILGDAIYSCPLLHKLYNHKDNYASLIIAMCADKDAAIEELKAGADDVLLHPFDGNTVKAISQIFDREKQRHASDKNGLVHDKLVIVTQDKLLMLHISQIVRCESDSNYTHIHAGNQAPIVVAKTLKQLENLLQGHNFLRVHRSHLVNIEHVVEYKRGQGASIRMTDKKEIEIAVRKRHVVLNRFTNA